MQFLPGMSAAVTIVNSFQFMLEANVMVFILPRGMRLRTVAPWSMLGRVMSST